MGKGNEALNHGLLKGYVGDKPPGWKVRGGVDFRSLEQNLSSGTYHDEWISGRNGGGQETFASKTESSYTRVYSGGVFPDAILTRLGTDMLTVESRLSSFIKGSEGKTRLDQDYFKVDGDWQYGYEVIERFPEIGLTLGIEKIDFKDNAVFVHLIGVSLIIPRS